jgi:exosome complex RNA-binding protein Rrp42 (RNase PH superfamily)
MNEKNSVRFANSDIDSTAVAHTKRQLIQEKTMWEHKVDLSVLDKDGDIQSAQVDQLLMGVY